jgi:hypothetical protein
LSKRNEWERRYGAARRAIDRKLLAEVEAQIAREDAARPTRVLSPWGPRPERE